MSTFIYSLLSAADDLSKWDELVNESPQGTLFCRSWWLRAVCGDDFNVLIAIRDGHIVAGMALPYSFSGKQKKIIRPPMTTTMGVIFRESITVSDNYERRLSAEIDLLCGLVAAIPNCDGFKVSFHPTISNWLPFYWQNYRQTTSYTYVLEDISDIDRLIKLFHHSKRKNLARAQKLVRVDREISVDTFYQHHKMTLKKEGKVITYTADYLHRIVAASQTHANVELLAAIDSLGIIHSAIVVLYDRVSAYYVASSIDPDYKNSGSATMLLVESIRKVAGTTNRFDFEGSMIPGVEQSFRRFGAKQVPYFVIYKEEGWRSKIRITLERIARKIGIKE